ncbi:sugar transferase [uncultured Sphingomonas sp.]|uniref:sugar transferase n=1 Tax=uncultured Sphingomonas sp. TaxID=158754 RepID=UPI0025945B79|nr:sugar transferase [uncultured Sphingomonas sp.]
MVTAGISTLLTALIGTFLVPILREEFQARAGDWAGEIVLWVATRMPEACRDRYFEEWLAYIDSGRTPVGRLVLSLGVVAAAARWRATSVTKMEMRSASFEMLLRGADLLIAICMIIAIAPVLIGLCLAVRLTSRGPALYRFQRVGKGGRLFYIAHFRTMRLDAAVRLRRYLADHPEEMTRFERGERLDFDPRYTPIGNFLQVSCFDMLPRIFNVLNGSMSIVGPMPITEFEAFQMQDRASPYLSVKPGITGLYQVFTRRSYSPRRRHALDRFFVRRRGWKLIGLTLMMSMPAALRLDWEERLARNRARKRQQRARRPKAR